MSAKHVVYLSNLPHDVNKATIEDVFLDEGNITVEAVELLKKGGGIGRVRACGLAVVYLSNAEDLQKVLKELDGKDVLGRPMIVRLDKFEEDQANYTPKAAAVAVAAAGTAKGPETAGEAS